MKRLVAIILGIALLSGCNMCKLNVVNGSGSGSYKPLATVNVAANQPGTNAAFDTWTGDISGIDSANSSSTTISMNQLNKTITATYTNIIPPEPTWPMLLGAWGGRPDITLDNKGGIHIVVDGGSTILFGADIVNSRLTTYTLNGKDCNPKTKQLFNPSTIVLDDGTQLITAWFFAFEDITGCNPPYVWYRQTGQSWKTLGVPLFTLDWNNSKLCKVSPIRARIFGLQNVWADLEMNNGVLSVVSGGSYQSGSRGGGEKEARSIVNGKMVVANSGCRMNGGSYFRSEISCPNAVMWATYSNYPSMGSDDTGHCAVSGDLKNSKIGYVCASYNTGLIFNIWGGTKLLYPPNNLPVIDKNGWSGLYKYPLSMAACPSGGAYIVWTSGNGLYLGLINTTGLVSAKRICDGQIGALCVGADGTIHLVYNLAGGIYYRQVKP